MVLSTSFSFIFRLEYEQKRDMDSRIKKLESSIGALENELKQIQNKDAEVKLATEKAAGDINKWKEEVRGTIWCFIFFNFLVCG